MSQPTTPFVSITPKKNSLLVRLQSSKENLFTGLKSVEREMGWIDPVGESSLSIWTAIEVLSTHIKNNY